MGYSTKSVLFNGTTQYGTAGDVLGLEFEYTDDFSASCWCKTSTGSGIMMSKMCTQPGGNNFYRGWAVNGNGTLYLRNRNSTGDVIVVGPTNSIVDGNWHHVAATWKGNVTPVAADVSIYIDGMLEVPNVITDALTATIIWSGAYFNVGARGGGDSFLDAYFDGTVDSAAVYDKTLSAAEVLWLYNVGNPPDLQDGSAPSNLVWWCRMGENGTPPVLDDEVGINNLTLVNSPTIEDDAPEQELYQSTYINPSSVVPLHTWQQDTFPQNEYDSFHESPDIPPLHTWQQTFGGSSSVTKKYKMRAQDSGASAPGFVTWVVSDSPDWAGAAYPGGIPTPVGPMVGGSAIVADHWEE